MARAPKKQIVTKKHLARIERERLQSRYITIASIAVVVLVLGLIAYGLLAQYVFQPLQPVASVDGEKITVRDFQQMARFQQYQIYNQYQQTMQLAQWFGDDPSTNSYISSSLTQLQSQYQAAFVGQATIDQMIEAKLIQQEARNLGITVDAEEVEKGIQEAFGFFPVGTPTTEPTLEIRPTSTLSPLQMTLVPPTPTFAATTITEVLTPTQTPEFTATPTLEPSATPTSAPTATPTEYTQEAYKNDFNEFIQSVAELFNLTENTLKLAFENQLYRQKVMEAVLNDLKPEQEQVWARHILVADEETANLVIARLQKGEDFASLAVEFSTDSSSANGGDLGWFGSGQMVAEFETVAFSLGIGEVSNPVQSEYGWHIIQVLGHENRPLDSSDFDQYRQQKFQEWLDNKRASVEIETLNFLEYVPVAPSLPEANLGQ